MLLHFFVTSELEQLLQVELEDRRPLLDELRAGTRVSRFRVWLSRGELVDRIRWLSHNRLFPFVQQVAERVRDRGTCDCVGNVAFVAELVFYLEQQRVVELGLQPLVADSAIVLFIDLEVRDLAQQIEHPSLQAGSDLAEVGVEDVEDELDVRLELLGEGAVGELGDVQLQDALEELDEFEDVLLGDDFGFETDLLVDDQVLADGCVLFALVQQRLYAFVELEHQVLGQTGLPS